MPVDRPNATPDETPPAQSETPELDKLLKIADLSQTVGEFLDWLRTAGLHLCEYSEPIESFFPTNRSIPDILAQYFEIDRDKVEEERRVILERLAQRGTATVEKYKESKGG